MRLINCSTLQLQEFFGSKIPKYAILSHTWGDDEVSFADFTLDQAAAKTKQGYRKIALTCQQALRDDLEYAWVDTCCIDKSSSAELSEAINSMFAWYGRSTKCYAFLSDVTEADMDTSFPSSKWFGRGWTLQELLAPENVEFYDREWKKIGTKTSHAKWLSGITAIDTVALLGKNDHRKVGLNSFCVAKKMSWASHRETTRLEDTAYCLLGIFEINMPLLYGEVTQAFIRLQEEIIRKHGDDSILAWGLNDKLHAPLKLVANYRKLNWVSSSLLATSPLAFENCGKIIQTTGSRFALTMTNLGLQIRLQLVRAQDTDILDFPSAKYFEWVGLLSCSTGSDSEVLGVLFDSLVSGSNRSLARLGFTYEGEVYKTLFVGPRAAAKSIATDVIITRSKEDSEQQADQQGYLHIVVNESKSFANIGFLVVNGDGWELDLRGHWVIHSTWEPTTKLLVRQGNYMSSSLLILHFEAQWKSSVSKFRLVVRPDTKRTTLQIGTTSLGDTCSELYDKLADELEQKDIDKMIIKDNEGVCYQIIVTIHENLVAHWRIFDITIDAVRIKTTSVGTDLADAPEVAKTRGILKRIGRR